VLVPNWGRAFSWICGLRFQLGKSHKVARKMSFACNRQLISYRILFAFREFYSPKVLKTMRASLYITCYNDTLFPETGRAVVRLLERLGVELDFHPKQTCCGQMHANTGFRGEAFCQAKRFVRMYESVDAVVIPSSSCVAMIRDQYPGLFEELGNEELRRQFAALLPRIFELSEFVVDKLGVDDVGAYFPHRVTYHASCHGLRGIHLGDRPSRLMSKVRGMEQVPLANLDRCCGFGGTFSVKNAEVSSAMLAVKLQDVMATRAEFCTALDNSCLMHLGGAMHRQYAGMKTIHLAEILASTEAEPAEALS
jgi:L-lactate dehydrogenase complex protein LldE